MSSSVSIHRRPHQFHKRFFIRRIRCHCTICKLLFVVEILASILAVGNARRCHTGDLESLANEGSTKFHDFKLYVAAACPNRSEGNEVGWLAGCSRCLLVVRTEIGVLPTKIDERGIDVPWCPALFDAARMWAHEKTPEKPGFDASFKRVKLPRCPRKGSNLGPRD